MPLYEFACQTCGAPFEELVFNSSAIDRVRCPKCDSARVKKKVSTFAAKTSRSSGQSASAASCAPGSL
jgi:putative FmdB family regulatory protein